MGEQKLGKKSVKCFDVTELASSGERKLLHRKDLINLVMIPCNNTKFVDSIFIALYAYKPISFPMHLYTLQRADIHYFNVSCLQHDVNLL